MCAGVGSGSKFRKVPESSGVSACWCRFRRQLPEGCGELGVCYCRFLRQVPESSGVRWCRYRRQGSEGSGELRCGLMLCNFVRGSHVIVLNTFW